MKYIKHYNTIAQATADTTAFSPFVGYCNEVGSPIYLGGGINNPVRLINNGIYGLGVNLYIITGGTWDANISGNKIKVQIEGNVTLNGKVDCYSVEFGTNGHLTINPDARLRIWEGGIVNNDCDTVNYLTIKEDVVNNNWGEFLLHPNIIINNQPKASVEYYADAYGMPKVGTSTNYKWDRLTTPLSTYEKVSSNYSTLNPKPALLPGETGIWTFIEYYDEVNAKWVGLSAYSQMNAFTNYALTNNTAAGGITYTFKGNLQSNVANNIKLDYAGWNYMGNSFLSPMSISAILNQYNSIILWTNNQWVTVTDTSIYKTIPPLGAFIIKNSSQQEEDFGISYKDLIWAPSFEEDDETPTRNLAKGAPKSEPIDPKDMPQLGEPEGIGQPIEDEDSNNNQR